jgi:hypothetical protein
VTGGLAWLGIPWCCIIPTALSLIGASSPELNRMLMGITPLFFVLSLVFLGTANWWACSRKCERTRTRVLVLSATVVAFAPWVWAFIRMGWL